MPRTARSLPIYNGAPVDTLHRPLRDVRLSVTDRCNFRCSYCMPAEAFGPDFAFLPRACAVSAERRADRRDQPNLPSPVQIAIAVRHLARARRRERLQRMERVELRQNLTRRHHLIQTPAVAAPYVHVLNQAKGVAPFARERRKRRHIYIVDAAADYRVQFDVGESRSGCRSDSFQDALKGKCAP